MKTKMTGVSKARRAKIREAKEAAQQAARASVRERMKRSAPLRAAVGELEAALAGFREIVPATWGKATRFKRGHTRAHRPLSPGTSRMREVVAIRLSAEAIAGLQRAAEDVSVDIGKPIGWRTIGRLWLEEKFARAPAESIADDTVLRERHPELTLEGPTTADEFDPEESPEARAARGAAPLNLAPMVRDARAPKKRKRKK